MSKTGRIPDIIVQQIKEQSDIVSIVEGYVSLPKKSGSNLFGLCPFHGEATPSFSVAPLKQIYYCFGCHKGGDVINFISEIESISYVQAIQFLAKKANIEIPQTDFNPYEDERNRLRKHILNLYLEAAKFYYLQKQNDPNKKALQYCAQRMISPGSQTKFGLGYAPDSWDSLFKHLERKQLLPNRTIIEKSGLFKANKQGGYYDLLRDRLIFPLIDSTGNIIAFGGRSLDNQGAKYINSPETPIYTKGEHLFGFNFAKKSKTKRILLVEGYLDAITAHAAGIDYAVATLGTALTLKQIKLLAGLQRPVTLAFDGDSAGQQAILRSLDLLKTTNLDFDVLVIKDAKDPDEYIKKFGPEAFKGLLQKTTKVLDFKISLAKKSSIRQGELDKMAYQQKVFALLLAENNRMVADIVLNDLAMDLGCRLQSLNDDYKRLLESQTHQEALKKLNLDGQLLTADSPLNFDDQPLKNEIDATMSIKVNYELDYLAILMQKPSWYLKLATKPRPQEFTQPHLAAFYAKLIELIETHFKPQALTFVETPNNSLRSGDSYTVNPNDRLANSDFTRYISICDDLENFPSIFKSRLVEILMNLNLADEDIFTLQRQAYMILREYSMEMVTGLSQQLAVNPDNNSQLTDDIKFWSAKNIEYRQKLENI